MSHQTLHHNPGMQGELPPLFNSDSESVVGSLPWTCSAPLESRYFMNPTREKPDSVESTIGIQLFAHHLVTYALNRQTD